MFNVGAFAGGLAEGIRSGRNMSLRQKQEEREADNHQARTDKAAFHKDKRNRLRAANDEIAEGWREATRQRSMPSVTLKSDQSGSDSDGPIETGQISSQSAGSFSTGGLQSLAPARPVFKMSAGLMSQYKNPAAQKNPDKTPLTTATANEMIEVDPSVKTIVSRV